MLGLCPFYPSITSTTGLCLRRINKLTRYASIEPFGKQVVPDSVEGVALKLDYRLSKVRGTETDSGLRVHRLF